MKISFSSPNPSFWGTFALLLAVAWVRPAAAQTQTPPSKPKTFFGKLGAAFNETIDERAEKKAPPKSAQLLKKIEAPKVAGNNVVEAPPTEAARDNRPPKADHNPSYSAADVEEMPQLPGGGGSPAISRAIQRLITEYPAAAAENGIQGKVYVSFIIGKDGLVHNAKIVRGIGGGCDEAVLTAVHKLPHCTPGKKSGKPVPVSFTLPVVFALAED